MWHGKRLSRKGFNLIEITIAMAFLSVALPAVVYLFGFTLTESSNNSSEVQAYFLATGLMNEVSKRRFRESAIEPGNGPETGEIDDFNRSAFDDIDDYNVYKTTWSALSPPRSETGTVLSDFTQFSQYVEVTNVPDPNVDASSRELAAQADGTTNFKLVKVQVAWDHGRRSITLYKIFAMR